jgi:hypothetical protein
VGREACGNTIRTRTSLAATTTSAPRITHTFDDKPWIEGYSADGVSRQLDYSDPAMLKQQTL